MGERLVEEARYLSPARMRSLARSRRSAPRKDRHVRWGWTDDGAALCLSGRLPADEGQYVASALDRLRDQVPPDAETGLFDPPEQRAADALVELCSLSLEADPQPDRATLVVHLDAHTLEAETPEGTKLPRSMVERLLCDAHIAPIAEEDGRIIGIGRRSRQVPHWVRRALHARDRSCQFPGCWRTRWTHAHHIDEWIRDDGPTDLDNLVRLCGHHHRAVHRGIRIERDPDGGLRFYRPDGKAITVGTQRLDPSIRERFIGGGLDPP